MRITNGQQAAVKSARRSHEVDTMAYTRLKDAKSVQSGTEGKILTPKDAPVKMRIVSSAAPEINHHRVHVEVDISSAMNDRASRAHGMPRRPCA